MLLENFKVIFLLKMGSLKEESLIHLLPQILDINPEDIPYPLNKRIENIRHCYQLESWNQYLCLMNLGEYHLALRISFGIYQRGLSLYMIDPNRYKDRKKPLFIYALQYMFIPFFETLTNDEILFYLDNDVVQETFNKLLIKREISLLANDFFHYLQNRGLIF